jgi:parallel beta-helix repeat protein
MYRPSVREIGLALVASACALLCAPAASASTIWVDRSGAVATISEALHHAQPGDTILLRDGVYPEWAEGSPRGSAEHPITIRPASGANPVVSGGFKLIHASHVRVIGLTFDGTGNPEGFGTSIWDGHDITFAHNEITGYGAAAQGVLIKERSSDVRIVDNHIHHLGLRMRYDHGIYCESARDTVIEGNTINDIPNGYGIHLFGDCDGTRIVGNTIAHNGLSGIIIAGNHSRGTSDRTLIARNVIADHRVAAWSEYGFAVFQFNAGRHNVIRDNVFFGNAARKNVDCDQCVVRDNAERNPRFVNPARANYTLRRGPVRALVTRR